MKKIAFIILLLPFINQKIFAQLSGYNLMEFQYGNLPNQEPGNLSTLYDQLNAQYKYKNIRAGIKYEQFLSSDTLNQQYQHLSQYFIQYKKDNLELKLGNIYETLGRGMLFRTYEIKNAVLEDQIYRVRYGFYRDFQGAFVAYNAEKFSIKALRGKPLSNELPPIFEKDERRTDIVEAADLSARFLNQEVGTIIMRNFHNKNEFTYSSFYFQGNLPFQISYYLEAAQEFSKDKKLFDYNDDASYGIYLGLNYSYKSFGLSFELKDYHNFLIGSGITDPPTLVKEHTYVLLNRSTHVTDLMDESGYQVEAFYYFPGSRLLTINFSQAKNELFKDFTFREYFAEFHTPITENYSTKFFVDYSEDPFHLENSRISGGVYNEVYLFNSWSAAIDFETQKIERNLEGHKNIKNYYTGITLSKSSNFSASLLWEFTTDKFDADNPNTTELEDKKHFLGTSLSYKLNKDNTLSVFAGQRRGGPACTSGVCYEVLPFEGIEFRLITKF